jgi:ATP-dependent DNA helicase DinG
VLKFRQGIGRLIRSREDSGIVVVLDSRIVRTNYGSIFLESIPDCRRHIF